MSVKANYKQKKRKVTFFYLDGKLHKVLRIMYPQNLMEAWCFSDRKSVSMLYTHYKRDAKKALRTGEVVELMNCSIGTIKNCLYSGEIRTPEKSYALDGMYKEDYKWWSEEDVLELHGALVSHHIGRPRKDGKQTPNDKLPTAAQIKAFFRNEETLYVQTQDGRMVPVFEAHRW